jgi:hypothetical protein
MCLWGDRAKTYDQQYAGLVGDVNSLASGSQKCF